MSNLTLKDRDRDGAGSLSTLGCTGESLPARTSEFTINLPGFSLVKRGTLSSLTRLGSQVGPSLSLGHISSWDSHVAKGYGRVEVQ